MNIVDLTRAFAEAIHDDVAVNVWTNANYGQDVHVYMGADNNNLPSTDNCPLVFLVPDGKDSGHQRKTQDHAVLVTCEIDDDTTVDDVDYPNLVEYTGLSRVEAFRELVQAAILANIPADIANSLEDQLSVSSGSDLYPIFETFDRYTFKKSYRMGSVIFG